MVVLAIAILSAKGGKVLLSRQFVPMSRIRIEGLLIAFPKLIGTGGQQHTYVETDTVRYVYQPLEGLHLVMVTNKSSNIVEDLETLRMITQIIPEYCHALEEKSIQDAAFELIYAFDEIICMGHKESINSSQLKSYLSMVSHDETIAKMLKKSQEDVAKDLAKQKARELSEIRRREGPGMTAFRGGVSSDDAVRSFSLSGGGDEPSRASESTTGFGSDRTQSSVAKTPAKEPQKSKSGRRGMQLGKSKKTKEDRLRELMQEANIVDESSTGQAIVAETIAASVPQEAVSIVVEEKLTVHLNRDGGVDHMEVKGSLLLEIANADAGRIRLYLDAGETAGFQLKTHPNINKDLFAKENILAMKDQSRNFPTGNALGVLRWRMQQADESHVPLLVNCWPSPSDDGTWMVNVEYEQNSSVELRDVHIVVPCPSQPEVPSIDIGSYKYDHKAGVLHWQIEAIDSESSSGSMEMVVAAPSDFEFFPISVSFNSDQTLSGIRVAEVQQVETQAEASFSQRVSMSTEEYIVE